MWAMALEYYIYIQRFGSGSSRCQVDEDEFHFINLTPSTWTKWMATQCNYPTG